MAYDPWPERESTLQQVYDHYLGLLKILGRGLSASRRRDRKALIAAIREFLAYEDPPDLALEIELEPGDDEPEWKN